ncbi:hypothetical protein GCM10009839_77570 [Catenulispora yoronensis]|uniref:Peptidase C14 caspase domain-containing protein n=1 Tax=Catenulispora yoronensis TaxID=450799 RepID=A0ABN2VAY9_9ACTN
MSDSRPLRDYGRSRAVLVGAWDYANFPKVPAARNSLERMTSLLTGPLCGWPVERVETLSNLTRRGDLDDRLLELYEDVTDVALFYFVGHGALFDDELCLALCDSPRDGNRQRTIGIPFADVRRALKGCQAETKIVILDCCYSGQATEAPNTLAGKVDVMARTAGTGAFTMAASGAYTKAEFDPAPGVPNPQTFFTQYLVDTIEGGMEEHLQGVALGPLFTRTAQALARDKKPEPTCSNRDMADQFVLARNRRFVAGPAKAPVKRAERTDQLVLHAFRDLELELGGYDRQQVKAELQARVDVMSDPEQSFTLMKPFFKLAGRREIGYSVEQVDDFILDQRSWPPTFVHALRILLAERKILYGADGIAHQDLHEALDRCKVQHPETLLAVIERDKTNQLKLRKRMSPSIRRILEPKSGWRARRSYLRRLKSQTVWNRVLFTNEGIYFDIDTRVVAVPYADLENLSVEWTTRRDTWSDDQASGSFEVHTVEFRYQAKVTKMSESARELADVVEEIQSIKRSYPEK